MPLLLHFRSWTLQAIRAGRRLTVGAILVLAAQTASAQGDAFTLEKAQRTFDVVTQSVEQLYYDPLLKGLDWPELTRTFRDQLADKKTPATFYRHVNALLEKLNDSHTRVIPKVEAQTQANLAVSTGARGLRLSEHKGEIFVRSVVPDSPASRAGLRPGDVLELVAGELAFERFSRALTTYAQMPLASRKREAALARVLAAPRGRMLVLTVKRADAEQSPLVFVDDEPTSPPEAASVDAMSIDVSRLQLRRFRADVLPTAQLFLNAHAPRGFIFDLRGNDGGDLAVAMTLAERVFATPVNMAVELSRGEALIARYAQTRERAWVVGGKPNARDEPIAVLIDERCASACEVFAAALKENNRARVFGHASAGIVAGITPKPIELPDGSGLNISRLGILSPTRSELDNVGVTPHETCDLTPSDVGAGVDCVLRAAVKWLSGQIAY